MDKETMKQTETQKRPRWTTLALAEFGEGGDEKTK